MVENESIDVSADTPINDEPTDAKSMSVEAKEHAETQSRKVQAETDRMEEAAEKVKADTVAAAENADDAAVAPETNANAAPATPAPVFVRLDDKPVKAWDAIKRSWLIYYGTHRNGVVYSVTCAVIGICILLFGFWSVLLIVVMSGAGLAYGQYRDGDPRIVSFFQRHFGN